MTSIQHLAHMQENEVYICIIGVAILLPVIIPPDVVVTSQQPADGQLRISAIYTQNSDLYLAADSDIYRINQSPSPTQWCKLILEGQS